MGIQFYRGAATYAKHCVHAFWKFCQQGNFNPPSVKFDKWMDIPLVLTFFFNECTSANNFVPSFFVNYMQQ
jgi:hypothetical protein